MLASQNSTTTNNKNAVSSESIIFTCTPFLFLVWRRTKLSPNLEILWSKTGLLHRIPWYVPVSDTSTHSCTIFFLCFRNHQPSTRASLQQRFGLPGLFFTNNPSPLPLSCAYFEVQYVLCVEIVSSLWFLKTLLFGQSPRISHKICYLCFLDNQPNENNGQYLKLSITSSYRVSHYSCFLVLSVIRWDRRPNEPNAWKKFNGRSRIIALPTPWPRL